MHCIYNSEKGILTVVRGAPGFEVQLAKNKVISLKIFKQLGSYESPEYPLSISK